MLLKIAWRNVWRSKLRSGVIMGAIALGLWGSTVTLSLMFGMAEQRFNDSIRTEISHIQLHHQQFGDNMEAKFALPDGDTLLQDIQSNPQVNVAVSRVVASGMASTAASGTGVRINGIFPSREKKLTDLSEKIVEGAYLEGVRKNPVYIGQKLADKLKVGVRKKIVLTFQNRDGVITAGAFRVAGIFQTFNSRFDESQVFVKAEDLTTLLGTDGAIHEIAILINERDEIDAFAEKLAYTYSDIKIETWADLDPALAYMNNMMNSMLYVFMSIILFAILFGIINTMLMAILERFRELGMLMAVGMSKPRVFFMIVLETIFLAVFGGMIGLVLGWGSITYLGQHGLNLSIFADGLADFGVSDILYPYLDLTYYPILVVMIIITAIIAAIYPAIKALKLNPATAIRTI